MPILILLWGMIVYSSSGNIISTPLLPDTLNFHHNNNLWTGFDQRNGDIGDRNTAALEFPGSSDVDHILRGCNIIGYRDSVGDTIVVSNKIC